MNASNAHTPEAVVGLSKIEGMTLPNDFSNRKVGFCRKTVGHLYKGYNSRQNKYDAQRRLNKV